MGIVYVTTHLVMAICIVSMLYWSFKSNEAINEQEKLMARSQFYSRALKLVVVVITTGYRIAAGILTSYLK